jgi:hypothetical protein
MKVSAQPALPVVLNDEDRHIHLPDEQPLVPDGRYHFKLVSHRTEHMFNSPRLILLMSILDLGDYCGVSLSRYYNVKRLIGKPGKRGRFMPSRGGDFLIDYYNLIPGSAPRLDRLPMNPLYDKIVYAETATVKTNNRKTNLPEQMWHSKVSKLIQLRTDFSP